MRMVHNNRAVSPVISVLVVVLLVFSVITSIYVWGLPFLNSRKTEMIQERAESNLVQLDEVLEELSYGSAGEKVTSEVNSEGGTLSSSKNLCNREIVTYSIDSNYDFWVSGFDDLENPSNSFTLHMNSGSATNAKVYTLRDDEGIDDGIEPKEQISFSPPITTDGDVLLSTGCYEKTMFITLYDEGYLFGYIWLIDSDMLTFTYDQGSKELILEYGGIIQRDRTNYNVQHWPNIYEGTDVINSEDVDVLVLPVQQILDDSSISASGQTQSIITTLKRTSNRYHDYVYGLRVQYFDTSDDKKDDTWYDFIKENYKFDTDPNDDYTLLYNNGDKVWLNLRHFIITFKITL